MTRRTSRPVGGVDGDVIVRQVAGPDACRGFALVEVEAQRDFLLVERTLRLGFVEARVKSAPAEGKTVHANIDFRRIEARAGIPGGTDEAPPVGITAGDGGLRERGVGDSARDAL